MKAGNQTYGSEADFPAAVPVFPLSGALLLPGRNLPLNIFEPRDLAMTDHALAHDRLIGLIQPDPSGAETSQGPKLCQVGCLGRLTGFQETGDGRYRINLTGVCRFRPTSEEPLCKGFRSTRFSVEPADLKCCDAEDPANRLADRKGLLATFRRFLAANQMETDWDAVERTDDETLVTALCMMSPYGPAEKQALLEARDLNARAETLVAITEIALAKSGDASSLQ